MENQNKIIVTNQKIADTLQSSITYEYTDGYVPHMTIEVHKSTSLEFIFQEIENQKMEIEIHLYPNCTLTLFEKKTGDKGKLLFRYQLEENSCLFLTKIHDMNILQERDFFLLDGESSKVEAILKTISTEKETYDMTIQHNACYSHSNIINHAVNISGMANITVTTCIPKSIKGCCANQNNRIINLTNNHCVIRPNLLIDEYDVTANHSAYIGPFTKEEFFYLERLGILPELAKKMLIQGFIQSKVNPQTVLELEKYWR